MIVVDVLLLHMVILRIACAVAFVAGSWAWIHYGRASVMLACTRFFAGDPPHCLRRGVCGWELGLDTLWSCFGHARLHETFFR